MTERNAPNPASGAVAPPPVPPASPPAPSWLTNLREVIAVVLAAALVIFLVVHYWLLLDSPGDLTDLDWARRTYILSGLEALVFAGAGFLFGTQISRGTVKAAEKQAEDATERASTAEERAVEQAERADAKSEEAQASAVAASKGRMLAKSILAKQQARGAAGAGERGAPAMEESVTPGRRSRGPVGGAAAAADDLDELAALARELDGA